LEDENINFEQILEEIATEENWRVTYCDIAEFCNAGMFAGVTRWGLLV
jgi:hypothetical protein